MKNKILIRRSWTVAFSNAFWCSVPFAARTTLAAPRLLFVTIFEYGSQTPFINLSKLLTTRYNSASTRKVVVIHSELGDYKLDPRFVSGFIDGEGCFQISITPRKDLSSGWQVCPSFQICLHVKDKGLIVEIQNYLGVGHVTRLGPKAVKLRVQSLNEIETVIIHFKKYPLITKKCSDLKLFIMVHEIMRRKEHLIQEGLLKILAIKASMNLGLSEDLK